MEFYWLAKTLVTLSMDDKGDKQAKPLNKIRRLETKFTVLCRVALEINVKVKEWDPDNNDELVDVMGTSDSWGTCANPITIKEDEDEDEEKKQRTSNVARPSRTPQS
jgi:hypothetical protein